MTTTKEQERKALEKIRKIVAELGENSYVGTAFEGCFELAEENINNDFACSMKQRAEKAEADAKEFKDEAENLSKELEVMRTALDYAEHARPTQDTLESSQVFVRSVVINSKRKAEAQAKIIVKFADRPDHPAFTEAVKKNRYYTEEAEKAKQLVNGLQYYINL